MRVTSVISSSRACWEPKIAARNPISSVELCNQVSKERPMTLVLVFAHTQQRDFLAACELSETVNLGLLQFSLHLFQVSVAIFSPREIVPFEPVEKGSGWGQNPYVFVNRVSTDTARPVLSG